MRSLIRWNFVVAGWITVGVCVAFLVTFDPAAIDAPRNVGKAAIGPALLAFFEVAFWFMWYRRNEGRTPAACIGVLLLQPAIAGYLLPQVREQPMNIGQIQLFAYLAMSHLIWALAGNPLQPKKATDL